MAPRRVIPNRVYFVTRRCSERRFFLKPCARVNQALMYCLAEAAMRFGVKVLWFQAMSNHIHYGVHDPNGVYPAFMAHFHKMAAKVLNCHWGRSENLWSSEQPNVVACVQPHDAFGRMVYSLANPLKEHLVVRAHHWPGASSLMAQLTGKTLRIRRPHWFFDPNGCMPEYVELTFGRPPGYEDLSHETWTTMLRQAIAAQEKAAEEERRERGIDVLGVRAIKRQSHRDTPATATRRRGIVPRVAAKSRWARVEALQRNKRFEAAYRQAFAARRRGDTEVRFPYGTYQLHRLGLVRVEPPPA